MQAQPESAQSPHSLLLAGAVSGLLLFGAFLLGFLSLMGYTILIGKNWLVTLFDLNFRPLSTPVSALSTFSILDTTLMLLFGLLMASMYPMLRATSRAWAVVAAALPFLGVPVFLATGTAGRSAVLLAALVSSVLALRGRAAPTNVAIAGIIASATLLVLGDFATATFAPSFPIAILITAGYVLWTVWLGLVAFELARRARSAAG